MKQQIEQRLRLARDGFLRRSVSRTARGVRPNLDLVLAPVPRIAPSQWDFGDITSRALIAWMIVREVLGDQAGDPDLEQGLWEHWKSCLNPATGLAFVPDHSDPAAGQFYYHMWDQGMVFYLLVLQLQKQTDERERSETLALIRRLQEGCIALAQRVELHDRQGIPGLVPDFSRVLWWKTDCFWNDARSPFPARDFGKMHWINFTPVAGLLLRPQAILATLTNDPRDLELALELAGGFLCGFQEQRGSTSPAFDEQGRFKGHFSGTIIGVNGLVILGRKLIGGGNAALGGRYIDLAARVYRWAATDAVTNPGPGCSCGYFPETACYGPRAGVSGVNELCCTVDMIELACELAACAELSPRWASFCDLWDDVERFTINEIFRTQFTDPARLLPHLPAAKTGTPDGREATLHRLQGAWVGLRSFPSDLGWYRRDEELSLGLPQADAAAIPHRAVPQLVASGCCVYSAVRALFAAWKDAVHVNGGATHVRIVTHHSDGNVTIEPLPGGGLRYHAARNHRLIVRVPLRVKLSDVACSAGASRLICDPERRWFALDLAAGETGEVRWQTPKWSTQEKTGCPNFLGLWPGLKTNDTPTYRLDYVGNNLVRIEPRGLSFPYLEGL